MICSAIVHKLTKSAKKNNNTNSAIGHVSVVFEEGAFKFMLKDIYLMQAEDGSEFLHFPKRKDLKSDDNYISVAYPLNSETREKLTEIVSNEYHRKFG